MSSNPTTTSRKRARGVDPEEESLASLAKLARTKKAEVLFEKPLEVLIARLKTAFRDYAKDGPSRLENGDISVYTGDIEHDLGDEYVFFTTEYLQPEIEKCNIRDFEIESGYVEITL